MNLLVLGITIGLIIGILFSFIITRYFDSKDNIEPKTEVHRYITKHIDPADWWKNDNTEENDSEIL